jgi:16S rRNA G966 N2-methylase RsmD
MNRQAEGLEGSRNSLFPLSDPEPLDAFYANEIASRFSGAASAYDPATDDLHGVPDKALVREIRGMKTTPFYLAHSYPTKVPPEAILPYIEHYTAPGQTVLDPFAGSGMTGVAARLAGRHAFLNDLGVGAAHLAFNHCEPCDPDALAEAFEFIAEQCEGEFRWLYGTRCDGCRGAALVLYTLWSDVYTCPVTERGVVLWEVGLDRASGRVAEQIRCPHCQKTHSKRSLRRHSPAVPVRTSYQCIGACGKRSEHQPTPAERRLIKEITLARLPYPHPRMPLDPAAEMYVRCALHLQRIQDVGDFYTSRNLRALGKLWREISLVTDRRVRAALAFAFTNTAWHATKMRRFNARGGQRPLTGTLYVPQLSVEANPLPIMRHKIQTLDVFYRHLGANIRRPPTRVEVRIGCATALPEVPANSVDYIFTDPPFGSNIFYADLSLVWESWLGRTTAADTEAVINRSRRNGKTLDDYYQLMKSSFSEMHRVLKPGRWASVVFHNSDEEVWRAIQTAAEEARFSLVFAGVLDKSKRSMRAYIGERNDENIADGDVVLNLRKPKDVAPATASRPLPERCEDTVLEALRRHLVHAGAKRTDGKPRLDPHSIQYLHGLAIRTLLNEGHRLEGVSFASIRALCERHFIVENGRVSLPPDSGFAHR